MPKGTKTPRAPSKLFEFDREDDLRITFKNDGFYRCTVDDSTWCPHLEDVFGNRLDVKPFWNWLSAPDRCLEIEFVTLQVPMVMDVNLFQRVLVEPVALASKVFNACFVRMDDAEADGFDLDTTELDLGVLSPGEGVSVLRQAIKAQLVAHWMTFPKKLECRETGHGFMQQQRWERDQQTPGPAFMQFYCVQKTSKCIGCLAKAPDDFSEFVPEADASRWSK